MSAAPDAQPSSASRLLRDHATTRPFTVVGLTALTVTDGSQMVNGADGGYQLPPENRTVLSPANIIKHPCSILQPS